MHFRTLSCFAPFCEEKIGFVIASNAECSTDVPQGVAVMVLSLFEVRKVHHIYVSAI